MEQINTELKNYLNLCCLNNLRSYHSYPSYEFNVAKQIFSKTYKKDDIIISLSLIQNEIVQNSASIDVNGDIKTVEEYKNYLIELYDNKEILEKFGSQYEFLCYMYENFEKKNNNEILKYLKLYILIEKYPAENKGNYDIRVKIITSNLLYTLNINDEKINTINYNSNQTKHLLRDSLLYIGCIRGDEDLFGKYITKSSYPIYSHHCLLLYSYVGKNKNIFKIIFDKYKDELFTSNSYLYSTRLEHKKLFYAMCYENDIDLINLYMKKCPDDLYKEIITELPTTTLDEKLEGFYYKYDHNKFVKSLLYIFKDKKLPAEFINNSISYCRFVIGGLSLTHYETFVTPFILLEKRIMVNELDIDKNIANIISDYYLPIWVYEMANLN